MNAVALFLLLSSLVTAGVWSPPPENQHPNPPTLLQQEDTPKENKLASSSTHDVTKGTSSAEVDQDFQRKLKQALEKCRNKARDVIEEPPDAKEKGGVFEALTKAKETLSQEAQEAKDKVSEKAQQVKDTVGDVTQKAKEKVSEKAQVVKDTVGDATQKVKEKVTEKPQINVREEEEAAAREEGGSEAVEQQAAESTANDVMEGGGGEKDLSEILRRGREVGYDVLVYVVSPKAVEPAVGVVHLLGFAAAYGMCLWVTFVSSYVLGGALSRQQFGVVQSKIYPVYFRTMAYCVGLALVTHLLSHRKRLVLGNYVGTVEVFLGYNLLASLFMILFNLLYLEPRATKVMFDRMKLEKEEGRGRDTSTSEPSSKAAADPSSDPASIPVHGADTTSAPPVMPDRVAAMSQIVELSEKLKKLNAYSSFLNILTLMLLTWHLVYLGQHLHVTC